MGSTNKPPLLKVERMDGLHTIRCKKEDLDWESGNALSICVAGFKGQAGDPLHTVIHIEWYDGKLQVRMYDGGEDPVSPGFVASSNNMAMCVEPDPALTKAIYCRRNQLPRLLGSQNENVIEIVEKRLKEDK